MAYLSDIDGTQCDGDSLLTTLTVALSCRSGDCLERGRRRQGAGRGIGSRASCLLAWRSRHAVVGAAVGISTLDTDGEITSEFLRNGSRVVRLMLGESICDVGLADGGVGFAGRGFDVAKLIGTSLDDLKIHARGVDLGLGDINTFVTNHRVRLGECWPVPHPVEGVVGADSDVSGKLDISLAPKVTTLRVLCGLGELLLARLRDGAAVDLVALAVIVVASGQQSTTTITAGTIHVPDIVDGQQGIAVTGLLSAVNVDGSSIAGLIGLCCGQSDVTVLLVAHGKVVARSSDKLGILGRVIADGLLRTAEAVVGVDDGTGSAALDRELPEII